MKKKFLGAVAACLTLCMLLTGCAGYLHRIQSTLDGKNMTPFDQMVYTRPDMTHFRQVLEQSCAAAEKETSMEKLEKVILDFYDVYDKFYTNLALSMIYYNKDLRDTYWEAENAFCTENSTEVDAGLDRFYRVLAKSPLRDELETDAYFGPGYFESYEGESIYDEAFTALLEEETALQNEYYQICGEASAAAYYSEEYFSVYGTRMADVFLELVKLRREMAAYAGYDSYPAFAYDFYHVRDYTPEQAAAYLADIRAELVPLYRQVNRQTMWDGELGVSSEKATFAYVREMAQGMGGEILEAFQAMSDAALYDITYSPDKYDASFEIYLRDYRTPYIFMCPTGSEYDKLTFAHEFGHFCSDYASGGSAAGVDVAEIFSQGMEYLSLCYASDDGNLEMLKMTDCLCVYVEQAAYASFEHQVYSLPEEELTAEGIQSLYESIGTAYGFDSWGWDSRDYVSITHFFTSPLYIISYVVSNDAALQLYQMEKREAGTGLTCLQQSLATTQPYFLAFLREARLESPFEPGRITQVKQTLQSILG